MMGALLWKLTPGQRATAGRESPVPLDLRLVAPTQIYGLDVDSIVEVWGAPLRFQFRAEVEEERNKGAPSIYIYAPVGSLFQG